MDEESLEKREDNEGAGVSDMDPGVNRGTTRVDVDVAGPARLQRPNLTAEGVVQGDRPQAAATVPLDGASARGRA